MEKTTEERTTTFRVEGQGDLVIMEKSRETTIACMV